MADRQGVEALRSSFGAGRMGERLEHRGSFSLDIFAVFEADMFVVWIAANLARRVGVSNLPVANKLVYV